MKTVTYQVKDQASEMTKRELIDHVEHEMITALVTIEEDASGRSAQDRLDEISGQLAALLHLVQD